MKKILTLIFGLICLAHTATANAKSATTFVNTLIDDVIKDVLTADVSKEEKTKRFEDYMLNAVDTQAIAKAVLAQYWRTASPKERDDFIEAFKDMAIKMTAERFNMYNGQEVQFFSERPAQGKNQVFVDSTVTQDSKPIQVVWRVREKDGEYRIIDIIVEGVSITLNYRNEYTSYLQNHSIQDLIEELKLQAKRASESSNEKDAKPAEKKEVKKEAKTK